MKYINADKLKAEIERRRLSNRYIDTEGYENELLDLIDSLQQEPRFPQYDNIVEKVFGAGNLEGWERDEAEILVALAKEELLKSLQQEQAEVIGGVVHHALGNHWVVVNQKQLCARLKQFSEGAEVGILVNARKEE